MEDVTFARAVHVLAVIHWIGGLCFVTTVVLPMRDKALFAEIERRFSSQVRISVPLAGLSGLYMTWKLDVWDRFLQPGTWWMAAMALLWLLFMVILFVVEPLAGRAPLGSLDSLRRAHRVLLVAAIVVAGAAVLGVHGLLQ
ncbi:Uncharacterized membrane protein [Enhydrobacter aerosaccus]|uniref:Uncharacterized membrane protein n=1 Tax=Enhydrobacter aerosaccus TaxID=225324 RepID=A0A1T4SQD2_9HYPH|nr:hypothetical protein [Enhydrobacter aerosaccus]SKA30098.1 Uncharacterized membrane protein [Enhydrobacter aerosaccus]